MTERSSVQVQLVSRPQAVEAEQPRESEPLLEWREPETPTIDELPFEDTRIYLVDSYVDGIMGGIDRFWNDVSIPFGYSSGITSSKFILLTRSRKRGSPYNVCSG